MKSLSIHAPDMREMGAVLIGNGIAAAGGFLSAVLLSRHMSQELFGTFSLAFAIATVVSGLTDAGIGNAAVRFISAYDALESRAAYVVGRVCLEAKLAIASLTLLFGLILAKPLSVAFFRSDDAQSLILTAFVLATFVSLATYPAAYLQAYQRFMRLGAVGTLTGFFRLALVLVLIRANLVSPRSGLVALVLASAISWLLGMWLSPRARVSSISWAEKASSLIKVTHYAKWVMISFVITSITSRIDIICVARYCSRNQVGIYGAALQSSLVIPLLITSVVQVLMPKVSRMTRRSEYVDYVKSSMRTASLLALLIAAALPASRWLITAIFGRAYADAGIIFTILAANLLLNAIVNPMSIVLYTLGLPRVFTTIHLLQLAISLLVLPLTTRLYGPVGTALGLLPVNIIGLAIVVLAVRHHLARMPETITPAEMGCYNL